MTLAGPSVVPTLWRTRTPAETPGTLVERVAAARGGVYDPRRTPGALASIAPPERLADMEIAADRLAEAIRRDDPILIHGDYDVDGSTGTAILLDLCRTAGSRHATGWIPDRREHGYGLSEASLAVVQAQRPAVVVTVDCGIQDHGYAARMEALGSAVIITDHHLPSGDLPTCLARINPNRPDDRSGTPYLAGCTVAWKLAWAAAQRLSGGSQVRDDLRASLMRSLGLVAIGTVADCVPLVGENQDLVARGLQILNDSRDPYMDAFRTALDLDEIQERDLGWRIGPVLNAGGRLSSAMRNLDILASRDPHLVRRSVRDAVAENTRRKHITQDLVDRCVQLVERMTRDPQDPIVLADPGFHAGVVGIAAGRLAERFAVPAAVIALDPVTGIGKGSLRSAGRVHLAQALTACAGTVLRGGGHAAAAGITIQSDRVAAFTRAFAAAVRDQGHPDRGRHVVMIDAGADLDECDLVTVRELDRLGPFGQGNPVPTLALTVTIDEVRPLGSKHFVMIDVHDATGTGRLKVIDGRTIPAGVRAGATLEVAVEVSAGSFRGTPQVDLLARAWREPLVAF